jgi:hypothetical protein
MIGIPSCEVDREASVAFVDTGMIVLPAEQAASPHFTIFKPGKLVPPF